MLATGECSSGRIRRDYTGLGRTSVASEIGLGLFEIGNHVTAKQLDRVHDPRMLEVPHLHEA